MTADAALKPYVLIVDDALTIRALVSAALSDNYEVDTAKDGEHAFERIAARRPDLIITDVVMPGMDGWAFVRSLRSIRETAFVPVIFLTSLNSSDDRIRGFRLGADDYLPKPFDPEELVFRVEKALRRASTSPVSPEVPHSPALTGRLEQFGVAAILNVLMIEQKSGELVLERDDGVMHALIRDGKVVRAVFEGNVPCRGEECIYTALLWTHGAFHFEPREIDAEDEVHLSTMHLLMEGARLVDERTRSASRPPPS